VYGGIFASAALVAGLFGILKWRSKEFDKTAMISLSVGILLLWLIPWGIFVIGPFALVISLISPAGRDEWMIFRTRRIAASLVLLVLLNSFALYPVSMPIGGAEWGDPITTENPEASSWPASEQYTWLHDGAAIGIVNSRTPHTFCPWSQVSSSMTLGIMLCLHDERMSNRLM